MPERTEDNYWGTTDFSRDASQVDSPPIALLKQQADKLTEITHGQVVGSVKVSARGGTIFASLYAGVPEPDDYEFKIVYVAYSILANPSHLTVEDSFGGPKKILPDMPAFEQYL